MIAVQVCIVTIAYMFGHDIIAIAFRDKLIHYERKGPYLVLVIKWYIVYLQQAINTVILMIAYNLIENLLYIGSKMKCTL